jgi:hypothetical protein
MLRRTNNLKASLRHSSADRNDVSAAMNEVLQAVSVLSETSHTNVTEITNLVDVELAYRRIDGVGTMTMRDEPIWGVRNPASAALKTWSLKRSSSAPTPRSSR